MATIWELRDLGGNAVPSKPQHQRQFAAIRAGFGFAFWSASFCDNLNGKPLRSGKICSEAVFRRFDQVALLHARLLIACLFVGGAVQKFVDPEPVEAMLASIGFDGALVWVIAVMNAGAGLALLLGIWVRPVALLLALYCGATSYFHWLPDDPWQMSIFVKNWAISGGCLALMVAGSGRLAFRPD